MILFGSRARGDHRPDSDIDVFVESQEEALAIPQQLLIEFGGPIDAFTLPGADGISVAMSADDDRRLLFDEWSWTTAVHDMRPIEVHEVILRAQELQQSGWKVNKGDAYERP